MLRRLYLYPSLGLYLSLDKANQPSEHPNIRTSARPPVPFIMGCVRSLDSSMVLTTRAPPPTLGPATLAAAGVDDRACRAVIVNSLVLRPPVGLAAHLFPHGGLQSPPICARVLKELIVSRIQQTTDLFNPRFRCHSLGGQLQMFQ